LKTFERVAILPAVIADCLAGQLVSPCIKFTPVCRRSIVIELCNTLVGRFTDNLIDRNLKAIHTIVVLSSACKSEDIDSYGECVDLEALASERLAQSKWRCEIRADALFVSCLH
jgi:hypothetical protein